MKKSKRAIKEVFKNKEFRNVLSRYFSGDMDTYDVDDLQIDSWGTIIHRFDMDKEGAEKFAALAHEEDTTMIDITYNDDSEFLGIVVRKNKGALLKWLLDIIGYEDWEDLTGIKFDPTKYDTYSEYVTLNSDEEADSKKGWE